MGCFKGLDEVAFPCSHSLGQNSVTWPQTNCKGGWEMCSPGGADGLMSTQLVRTSLGLDLRGFLPSSLSFSLVQVLLVGFLILANVTRLFPP